MVIVIFRHGARQCLLVDKEGPLTQAGKVQEYIFGKEMRDRYIRHRNFLPEDYNSSQIYLHSSYKKRCIESLQWFLSGLYPPRADIQTAVETCEVNYEDNEIPPLKINKKFSLPEKNVIHKYSEAFIDIEVVSHVNDLFYHAYEYCKAINQISKNSLKVQPYQEFQQAYYPHYKQFAEKVNKLEGRELVKIQDIKNYKLGHMGKLNDYYSYQKHVRNLASTQELEQGELIHKIKRGKLEHLKHQFSDDHLLKSSVTLHFRHLKKLIQNSVLSQQTCTHDQMCSDDHLQQKKLVLYSCHDRNILIILKNLLSKEEFDSLGDHGYYQNYASNLIFEIWQDDKEITLNASYEDIPIKLKHSDEKGKLTLDNFINLLDERTSQTLEHECQDNLSEQEDL